KHLNKNKLYLSFLFTYYHLPPYGVKYSSHSSGAVRRVRRSIAAQCGAVWHRTANSLTKKTM
uniref:Uncharacterized protein n=1 Tax=Romanomermis culicivorax TaxID=13658 RepID=A0A915JNB7_ROMCU